MYFYVLTVLPSIKSNQFAYQKGKGTVDAVIAAIDQWTLEIDQPNQKSTNIGFLDMSKAFDKMDRGKLITMLKLKNINPYLIRVIDSFLTNRTQAVRMNGISSSTLPVLNGTPQGTLLGPMFWLLYIDSLDVDCHIIKYADDLTLTSNTTSGLQNAVDQVAAWCKDHNMVANATKSTVLCVSNKRSTIDTSTTPQIQLEGDTILQAESAKFLGVFIDENLTFKRHIEHIISRARPITYVLLNLKRSGLPTEQLRIFYILCIRPIITYASPAWFSLLTQTQKDRLTRLEKIVLKIIRPMDDSYADRLSSLEILPIDSVLERLSLDHMRKIKASPTHCLHPLLPPTNSARGRHSTRLKDVHNTRARTVLRKNTFLLSYCNK